MKFAVQLPVDQLHAGDDFASMEGIQACSRHVETLGFDACFVTDHPIPGKRWLDQGGHHSFDPFVALTAAACATNTLQLFTNIVVLPYRNPFILAKSAACLDVLSNGRLILGVGAGYLQSEFDALGIDMSQRGRMMEDALQAIKLAWSGEAFSFESPQFTAENNAALPRPVRKPNPPIWMGGNSKAAMRRAAQYCDGWLPFPVKGKFAKHVRTNELADIEDLRAAIASLREMEQQFERDKPLEICMIPFGLDMHSETRPDSAKLLEQCLALQALGVGWINISLPCDTRQQYMELCQWFSEEIMAKMA
jgi:probable F420-dependent oxidoreductase